MKKTVSILLVLMVLLSETGVAFALHFCGDKLVSAQFSFGQEYNGCDMDNTDCDFSNSSITKSNCCADSEIRMAQNSTYEIFTFDLLKIRIPAPQLNCEQVNSSSFVENQQEEIKESPPPLQSVRRSRLQVYLIKKAYFLSQFLTHWVAFFIVLSIKEIYA